MKAAVDLARALLVSLVSEERRGRPGSAAEVALRAARQSEGARSTQLIVAVYAALAAGEPRHALHVLEEIGSPAEPATQRRVQACRAWAERLDRNWYPGDTGGELGPGSTRGFMTVGEVLPGDAETTLVEACAALGPANLLSVRSLLESLVRKSEREAGPVLQSGLGALERFKEIALTGNAAASACWAIQSQADLLQRSGHAAEAQQQLNRARDIYTAGGDGIGLACTYILEGDWFATPGSSPEALGLDLEGRPEPSPFADTQDTTRAADAYDTAESFLRGDGAPRVSAALALRRAVLCLLSDRLAEQGQQLQIAEHAFAEAGETSGRHLVSVHRLVGALSGGDFVELRRETPPEWGIARGPTADIAAWGVERGSLSFCTGLGRILERTAEQWEGRGDLDRAEIAYLMARPLISLSGVAPSWSVPMALAKLDGRRNLQVRSLVRRLRVLASLPPPPSATAQPIAWMRDVELTMSLIDIPTGRIGTGLIAIRTIERGAQRLRALLSATGHVIPEEPVLSFDAGAMRRDLQGTWTRYDPYAARPEIDSEPSELTRVVLATTVKVALVDLARATPQVSLLRALQAERLGWDAEADQWYQAALRHAEAAGDANGWLRVLILGAWGRANEARAVLRHIHDEGMIDKSLLPSVALRARDFATARELFRQLDESTARAQLGWIDLLDRAEAALECGDAPAAVDLAMRGVAAFEAAIDRLPRDSDRVAACDDVKAGSLYQIASRAYLRLADSCTKRGDKSGRLEALQHAFAIGDRGHALTLPRFSSIRESARSEGRLSVWQQTATDQATAYQRYLAALAADRVEAIERLSVELSEAEGKLSAIEATLDPAERRSVLDYHRSKEFTLADAQSLLPDGACLLEYHLVGRDLIVWGVTKSSVRRWCKRLSGRPLDGAVRRFLRSCASGDGSAEAETLATLLFVPVAELLRRNGRVIVVPFGPLHAVPFHVLPFRGEPLGVTHVVSYLPAASLLSQTAIDSKLSDGGALVVGDPAFDPDSYPSLRRLPGAALEAKLVGRLYDTPDVFAASDARMTSLRAPLHERGVLHFAAHGRLDEVAPNTSALILADRDKLTVSDLIGLRINADLAVLSACDTGRGVISLGGDLVGLTRGLLAAGAKRSVVSLWPVDDVAACVTMIGFHKRLFCGDPPAIALARTQREIRAMSGVALMSRYCELGGVVAAGDASTRRMSSEPRWNTESLRQLSPFPETDNDDTPPRTVEESHGSLSSIWGPFVLIGC